MKAANLFKGKYRSQTVRLEGFDYGTDGAYFITICSFKKTPVFSTITNGVVHLTSVGKIINEELEKTRLIRDSVTVTEWVIMPDHIHFVIFIHKNSDAPEHLSPSGTFLHFPEGYKNKFGPQRENIASIIRGIKSTLTTQAKKIGLATPIWQSKYYERIIRNEKELNKFVLYIKENPHKLEKGDFPENM